MATSRLPSAQIATSQHTEVMSESIADPGNVLLEHLEAVARSVHDVLPPELMECILIFCDARGVSSYAQTCRFARALVYNEDNQSLWRELYLRHPFDDLRNTVPVPRGRLALPAVTEQSGWREQLQRRTEAELIAAAHSPARLARSPASHDVSQLRRAFEAFLSAIQTAAPAPVVREVYDDDGELAYKELADSGPSHDIRWVNDVLRRTRVLDLAPSALLAALSAASFADTRDAYQALCRLRAFVALSYEATGLPESVARMAALRRGSRCFVYDMRKYTQQTLWGPYRVDEDGRTLRVNWEHVEHIVNVVGMKLREVPLKEFRDRPLFRMDALRPYSAPDTAERKPYDWAGVTGRWRRFVCFMDYRDLYSFNYSLTPPGPHNASYFDEEFEEAMRPVELRIEALDPAEHPELQDTNALEHDPRFPTIQFRGVARNIHSTPAVIKGSVSTLVDGAIRWEFVTIYEGRSQWSAEGVQLGHVCSAAGLAGIWTGASHERDDPAGPFWMLKVSDELPDGVLNTLF